jgi:hypothetical protein
MHFTIRVSTNAYTQQTPAVGSTMAPTILPFPMSGKFRCRIVGYEFICTDVHTCSVVKVVSRALLNPMQPDKVFQFIPDRSTNALTDFHQPSRVFSGSGWWPVELHNSIDVKVVPDDDFSTNQLGPFVFLLHLDLEKFPEENAHRMK